MTDCDHYDAKVSCYTLSDTLDFNQSGSSPTVTKKGLGQGSEKSTSGVRLGQRSEKSFKDYGLKQID